MSETASTSATKASRARLRASRACDRCHGRKVRCDITRTAPGQSCTNCRLDRHTCVSYAGSRARPARISSEQQHFENTPDAEAFTNEANDAANPHSLQLVTINDGSPPLKRLPNSLNDAPTSDLFNSLNFRIPDRWMSHDLSHRGLRDTETQHFKNGLEDSKESWIRFGDIAKCHGLEGHLPFAYYKFLIFENLSIIQSSDCRFLEFNGSLHIPVKPLLDEFVKEYFLHVHPGLPMLDEALFWTVYEPSERELEKSHKVSLFLFQAMLFASCSFVSLDVLRCCGFESTRQARAVFYRRAKSLFDLDMAQDYCSIARGALLLTYYSTNNESHINTYWLGMAIQNAKHINAPLYDRDRTLSNNARLTRKRLWWCCILRDRILPLGVRRPIQITHAHFDFSKNRITEEDMQDQIGRSQVYTSEIQKLLIKIFISQCELAVHLTDIVMTVYPVDGTSPVPPASADELRSIETTTARQRADLMEWFQTFNLWAASVENHVSVILFTKLLFMYYHSARIALCHYEILVIDPWTSNTEDHGQRLESSKSDVRSAIDAINEDMRTLILLKVAQYLPVSAVAFTALPLVLSAIDLRLSSKTSQMDARRRQLEVYIEATKLYLGKYDGTEQVCRVIDNILSDAESQTVTLSRTANTSSSERSITPSNKSEDWYDVFTQHPKFHMRLTLSIDLSFSKGRLPQDSEFPTGYRATQVNESLAMANYYRQKAAREHGTPFMATNLFTAAWAVAGKSTGTVTPVSEETQQILNLDFADLFGEQSLTAVHGWVEDDVEDLFDDSIPI